MYHSCIIIDGFKISNYVKLVWTDATVDPERSPMVVVIFHMQTEGSLNFEEHMYEYEYYYYYDTYVLFEVRQLLVGRTEK